MRSAARRLDIAACSPLLACAADFNFDGLADAVWQNAAPTRVAVWLMSRTHLLWPGPEIPGPADVEPGDPPRRGRSRADPRIMLSRRCS